MNTSSKSILLPLLWQRRPSVLGSARLMLLLIGVFVSCFAFAAYDDGTFFSGNTCEVRVETDGWTLINDNHERRLQITPNGLQTVSILKKPENVMINDKPASEGRFTIDGVEYDLSNGWVLDSSAIENGFDKKTLSVTMLNPVTGYKVTNRYTLYQGSRFWIKKQMRIQLDQPRVIADVEIDSIPVRFELMAGWYFDAGNGHIGVGGTYQGLPMGVACFASAPQGNGVAKKIIEGTSPNAIYAIRPTWQNAIRRQDFDQLTAFSLYFTGSRLTCPFAMQLANASAFSSGHPWKVPVVYNTWYATGLFPMKEACLSMIAISRAMGCKLFVVDDGWQRNVSFPNGYGDWLLNTAYFSDDPNSGGNGLQETADFARSRGMKFGLWFAPGQVYGSAVRAAHPEWGVYNPAQGISPTINCFASDFGPWITNNILTTVQQTNADFLKLDFDIFVDQCAEPTHDHVQGRAIGEQYEDWKGFLGALRNYKPDIVIDRSYAKQFDIDVHDQGWTCDWVTSSRATPPNNTDIANWRFSMNLTRSTSYYPLSRHPSYAVTGTSPAHIDGLTKELNLLEYCLVSVAAMYANMEISNNLFGQTSEEFDLASKWVKFNWQMRPWLTYTQVINSASDPTGKPDAYWHLRNLYLDRYGFLVVFNRESTPKTFSTTLDPKTYFLDMDLQNLSMTPMNPNAPLTSQVNSNNTLTVSVQMPPHSWQVIDIKTTLPVNRADINKDGCVDDFDLFLMTQDFLGAPLSGPTDITGADDEPDGIVDDFDLFYLTQRFLDGCN